MKHYIEWRMPKHTGSESMVDVTAAFETLAERNDFYEFIKGDGVEILGFGQYSQARRDVEVFEEADEGFLDEYHEFLEAI